MPASILIVDDDPMQRRLLESLLARMREAGLTVPVIVETACGSVDNAVSALRAGASDLVVKPARPERPQGSLRNELPRLEPSPAMTAAFPEASVLRLLDADGEVRALEEIECEVLRFAIAHYRGQMSEVARRLKIGRSTLYRKLDGLGPAEAGHRTPEKTAAE
jgi:DNA-binding NtrC family response regulator